MNESDKAETDGQLTSLGEFLGSADGAVPFGEIERFVKGSRWYLGSQSAKLDYLVCTKKGDEKVPPFLLRVMAKDESGEFWNLPVMVSLEPMNALTVVEVSRPDGRSWFLYDACSNLVGQKALLGDLAIPRKDVRFSSKSFEQSNTSFIYGDLYVKLYRRLVAHKNREVKVLEALLGVLEGEVPRVIGAGELCGYSSHLVLESLDGSRDLYGVVKDLLIRGETEKVKGYLSNLGATLFRLHKALRGVFGTGSLSTNQLYAHSCDRVRERITLLKTTPASSMYDTNQLDRVFERLSELTKASQLGVNLSATEGEGNTRCQIQVIHGDLHLGQILLYKDRQVVIDFEGEVLGETGQWFGRPEYDLAGIARSIHYASFESGYLSKKGSRVSELEEAFVEAYTTHLADSLDSAETVFDRKIYELLKIEKAVYELEYEVRAQRGLVAIPASFLFDGGGEQSDERT